VEKFLAEEGIPSTKAQHREYQDAKISAEHAYWTNAINKILKGYDEDSFQRCLIKFLNELDFSNVTDE